VKEIKMDWKQAKFELATGEQIVQKGLKLQNLRYQASFRASEEPNVFKTFEASKALAFSAAFRNQKASVPIRLLRIEVY
jgi:hypothetical protein